MAGQKPRTRVLASGTIFFRRCEFWRGVVMLQRGGPTLKFNVGWVFGTKTASLGICFLCLYVTLLDCCKKWWGQIWPEMEEGPHTCWVTPLLSTMFFFATKNGYSNLGEAKTHNISLLPVRFSVSYEVCGFNFLWLGKNIIRYHRERLALAVDPSVFFGEVWLTWHLALYSP